MKDKSSECISLSVEMVTALEQSVDALPDAIERYVEGKANEAAEGEMTSKERSLADVDSDLKDLSDCIDAIENLRLVTAVQAGNNAFRGITDKGQQCHKMYQIIQKFALSVTSITEAFMNLDVGAVISKAKDILRVIDLTLIIEKFAEGCKKMMDKIVQLFQAAAGKLSLLWKSLVATKDKMIESLSDVVYARSFCTDADERLDSLKEQVQKLGGKFWNAKDLGPGTYKTLRSMDNDRSLDNAIQTLRGIDDSVEAAIQKMKNAAQRVQDEYEALPPMITDGISDTTDVTDESMQATARGSVESLQAGIQDMEFSTKTIEESNILDAAKAMHKEMKSMDEKVDRCSEMLAVCSDFADKSKSSIDSFMGKWTLETAVDQMQQMSRLVSFSEVMEQIAGWIQQLLRAMVKLLNAMAIRLKAVMEKAMGTMGIEGVVDAASDLVTDSFNNAIQNAGDFMGSLLK